MEWCSWNEARLYIHLIDFCSSLCNPRMATSVPPLEWLLWGFVMRGFDPVSTLVVCSHRRRRPNDGL